MKPEDVRILVVDDDQDLADMLVTYLAKMGYQAEAAYTGRSAFNLFYEGGFQLVISDLMLPDTNGIALMEQIKTADNKAIVMVITGHGSISVAVDAMKKGAYDFIAKPFQMEQLKLIVDRAVDRRSLADQVGVFRGLTLALLISVPAWLVLGIMLGVVWN